MAACPTWKGLHQGQPRLYVDKACYLAPEEQAPPKVADLMEALRKSLDQVSADKKKTAKAGSGVASMKVTSIKGVAKNSAKKRKAS